MQAPNVGDQDWSPEVLPLPDLANKPDPGLSVADFDVGLELETPGRAIGIGHGTWGHATTRRCCRR